MKRISGRSSAFSLSSLTLTLLLLFSFVALSAAQGRLSNLPDLATVATIGGQSSDGSAQSNTDDSNSASATAGQSASNTRSNVAASATTDNSATSASNSGSQTSGASQTSESSQTSATGKPSISLLEQSSTSASSSSAESTPTGSQSIFHLSGLPTIAGATDPTQVVPYTANAPFMRKSNMPEGTVFIIVGAILGFFGACVLAWRGLVAWSLSRSVKRAARTQHQTFDLKTQAYPAPSAGMYTVKPPGSSASMEKFNVAAPKMGKRGSHRPPTSNGGSPSPFAGPNARASMQNLFFSPTAGAGVPSHTPSPRPSSSYLPAGYYAAGASHPAGGAPSAHINGMPGNRGSSLLNPLADRLSGIRAESAGYHRTNSFGPSPPGSPHLGPMGGPSPVNASSTIGLVGGPTAASGLYAQQSASSLNLSVPGGAAQGARTPSAYLEDLFENHPAPGQHNGMGNRF